MLGLLRSSGVFKDVQASYDRLHIRYFTYNLYYRQRQIRIPSIDLPVEIAVKHRGTLDRLVRPIERDHDAKHDHERPEE
jgi:hypothetical protein